MLQYALILLSIIFIMFPETAGSQTPYDSQLKIFESGYIEAIGRSEEGQTRMQALRAAEVLAQRNLVQALEGLTLNSSTTVKDGLLQNDEIRTTVNGFLRGAVKCGEHYYPERKSAEVCLRLQVRGRGSLYETILPLLKSDSTAPASQADYRPEPEATAPRAAGTADADGLIVDVRDMEFRPALANRIFNERGEVLFDPSKIVSSMLVERGCGGFTTDMQKARALLATWGCTAPAVVKPLKVTGLTDVQVSAADATAIFAGDQKAGYLGQARVVFVLK